MTSDTLQRAFASMYANQHGGFAARLAEAWFHADSLNKARIEQAFPELIERALWSAMGISPAAAREAHRASAAAAGGK